MGRGQEVPGTSTHAPNLISWGLYQH